MTKRKTKKSKTRRFILSIFVLVAVSAWFYFNHLEVLLPSTEIDPEQLAIPSFDKDEIVVHHNGYTLSYSEENEQPFWVAYVLTKEEVQNNVSSRADNFRSDPDIPTGSASLADYKGSGYDRGHLIPAADLHWSDSSMDDSFYMSNMSPQKGSFNRGIWAKLEDTVRDFAVANQSICVVTGPVLSDGPYKTIGKNKVSVPNFFYKVILDYSEPELKAIGFILPNEGSNNKLSSFAVSVDEVEKITGIDFFSLLNDKDEQILESGFDLSLWNLI